MPQIPLHLPNRTKSTTPAPPNPLPQLLHTPTGLALIEIQGTINTPHASGLTPSSSALNTNTTAVGKLVFPLYPPADAASTAWMKRAYLYVGSHQRLTGEVKKLARPVAVIRRRAVVEEEAAAEESATTTTMQGGAGAPEADDEALEIVEVVRYKVVFASRPEPVSGE